MPRLGHLLTAVAALGVLAVALLGGHKDDAVAFQLADADGALSLTNSRSGAAFFHGEACAPACRSTAR